MSNQPADNRSDASDADVVQTDSASEFSRAAEEQEPGLVAEFSDFLRHNASWWLTPIIIVVLALGLIAFLTSSAAAPFIYPLF